MMTYVAGRSRVDVGGPAWATLTLAGHQISLSPEDLAHLGAVTSQAIAEMRRLLGDRREECPVTRTES